MNPQGAPIFIINQQFKQDLSVDHGDSGPTKQESAGFVNFIHSLSNTLPILVNLMIV